MAKKKEKLRLDADRPILEQLEERTLAGDEQAEEELNKILDNPRVLSYLESSNLTKMKRPR